MQILHGCLQIRRDIIRPCVSPQRKGRPKRAGGSSHGGDFFILPRVESGPPGLADSGEERRDSIDSRLILTFLPGKRRVSDLVHKARMSKFWGAPGAVCVTFSSIFQPDYQSLAA
jgi:hypothetical protein